MDVGRNEVNRCIGRAEKALAGVKSAKLGRDLRDSWEDFLDEYSKGIGKLISLAKVREKTRVLGHRLKSLSVKDDDGLVFLREARNADVHGLEPSARYEDGMTSLFGAFGLGPNCIDCHFSNNIVNGVNTGKFTVSTDEYGRISKLESTNPVFASYTPASIRLRPVYSAEKKRSFPIPLKICGNPLESGSPLDLGLKALKFLKTKLEEYDELLRADDS